MSSAAQSDSEGEPVLIGAVGLGDVFPTFVTPCFRYQTQIDVLVQLPDMSGLTCERLAAFDVNVDSLLIQFDGRGAGPGKPLIFGFAWSKNEVTFGYANEIVSQVLARTPISGLPVGCALQLADLARDEAERRSIDSKLQAIIGGSLGDKARSLYEESSLRAELWDIVAREKPVALSEWTLHKVLNSIDVKVSVKGICPVLTDEFRAAVGPEFVSKITSHLRLSRRTAPQPDLFDDALAPPPQFNGGDVETLLRHVMTRRRQEERISLIIQAMVERPEIGIPALYAFHDKSAFSNRVAELLKRNIPPGVSDETVRWIIASLIRNIFSTAFPMSRGLALHDLAYYLGRYPEINVAIRKKLRSTKSKHVEPYRRRIEDYLELGLRLPEDRRSF